MPSNKLHEISVKVRNFKCFGPEPGGFDRIEDLNIIIGRNNSGKSTLVDLLELCASKGKTYDKLKHSRGSDPLSIIASQTLDEASIERVFSKRYQGGNIPGSSHFEYGRKYIGHQYTR